jgi:hypothetical protein
VNADGWQDLLVTSSWGLSVFLADGQGGFSFVFEKPELRDADLAVADFDGDGIPDLVSVTAFYPGHGNGVFGVGVPLIGGPYTYLLAVADFNSDGRPDLAVSTFTTAVVLLSNGNGQFTVGGSYSEPSAAIRVAAAGEVNGDGHPDLVVLLARDFSPPSSIRVLLGDGLGGLTPGTTLPAQYAFEGPLALADFDGDGVLDLLVGGAFGLYPGMGGGAFGTLIPYDAGVSIFGLADFNGDGRLDVAAIANGEPGVSVLVNDGPFHFAIPPAYDLGANTSAVSVGHLHSGGHADLVVASADANSIAVLAGAGDGTFGPPVSYPVDFGPSAVAVADFNNDGHPDVAVSNGAGVAILLGDGAGHLGPFVQFSGGTGGVAAGDLDGDGNIDLVTSGIGQLDVLMGDGNGGFANPVSVPLEGTAQGSVVLADVDGDGHLDILAATGDLTILFGNGNGTFGPPITVMTDASVWQLVAGDWNGDGHLDVAFVGFVNEFIWILPGDGTGQFGPATSILIGGGTYPHFLVAADFNADGHPDLAAANPYGGEVDVLIGDGNGGFGAPFRWSAFGSLLATGDWNEDGRPDLAAVGGATASILPNTNCQPRVLGVSSRASACNGPGAAFQDQPVVTVYDDGGNVAHCDAGSVVAALRPGSGTPGATLGGTTNVSANAGIAAFTDLSIDLPGTGYALNLSHPTARSTGILGITVGTPPPAPAASNSGSFCQGQDLELFATTVPGAVYRWTGPNGFVSTAQSPTLHGATLAAAGTYSVTALVAGCSSSATQTTVAALPPLTGPTIQGQHQVCGGTPFLLRTDVAANAYQWYLNGEAIPGATGPSYRVPVASGADAGYYTVTTSDASGCTTNPGPAFAVGLVSCTFLPAAIGVDSPGDGGNGNGILEPGESVVVHPSWGKTAGSAGALTGTATAFVGPPGGSYTIDDASANYGTIPPATIADCATATGDCYGVTVTEPNGVRPSAHWDTFLDETPASGSAVRTWVLHVGGSFSDVPTSHPFYASIERILHNRITAGCSPSTYCPSDGINRAQMAVLLLKARHPDRHARADGRLPAEDGLRVRIQPSFLHGHLRRRRLPRCLRGGLDRVSVQPGDHGGLQREPAPLLPRQHQYARPDGRVHRPHVSPDPVRSVSPPASRP